ncbi:MAG: AAA family ATPase [Fimbriimonadales bacterium]|nr:AAA family ATPase [Fimbriimonadales bacterium]
MSPLMSGLREFLAILPTAVRERLEAANNLESLVEVVLDYGRPAEARYRDRADRMQDIIVTENDIDFVVRGIGDFGSDNRAGIERTLHRISCIRNRRGKIVGLTCRVGRALEGTIDIMDDIVRSGQSILLLGKPGIGKTTKLREIARVLADEVGKRVVIVDTSNEIAGDGDIPHPGIGSARRMQVRSAPEQHQVMIEAVENHMPEVIVIDEIGTEAEAMAARTIAERGVQLVATAHGQTLENLMLNPTLCDLIGGIQAVTLSDDEARRRGTQKTVLERKAPPTFDVVIELIDFDRMAVHHNVQKTVDLLLRGVPPKPEIRARTGAGSVEVVREETSVDLPDPGPGFDKPVPAFDRIELREPAPEPASPIPSGDRRSSGPVLRIFPYGIARTRLERAIREKRAPAVVAPDSRQADAVMAIRSAFQGSRRLRDLPGPSLPTVVVKSNTFSQIAAALDELLAGGPGPAPDQESEAMEEVLAAIETVQQTGKPVELAPRPASIRRLQFQMVQARRLASEGVGVEPNRRVRILPTKTA